MSLVGDSDVQVTIIDMEVIEDALDTTDFVKTDLSQPAMLSQQISQNPPPTNNSSPLSYAIPTPAFQTPTPSGSSPNWDVPGYWVRIAVSVGVIPLLILAWVIVRNWRVNVDRKSRSWSQLHNVLFVASATISLVLLTAFWYEPQLWTWAVPGLVVAIPVAWITWHKTEIDQAEPRYRVRTIAGICGAVLMIALFVGLCFVPSWWQHGVATVLAGIFGLLWIVAMQCFIRSRRFSIMTILSLATCIAMVMAGYEGATRQIRARQRMMDALDRHPNAAYEFDLVEDPDSDWIVTPEGMLIHHYIANALGRASIGEVGGMTLPHQLMTAENLRSWNMEDVSSIHVVGDESPQESVFDGFAVSADAIDAIPRDCPLVVFYCDGGAINDDAMRSLGRFHSLCELSFDAQGKKLPNSLDDLSSLETLTLKNAKIDQASSEVLGGLPESVSIQFVNVTVAQDGAQPRGTKDSVFVLSCTVTPSTIDWLRNSNASWVWFRDCAFDDAIVESDNPLNAEEIGFESSPLTDKIFLTLAESPNIRTITLQQTNVTTDGMDQFSAKCPQAIIEKSP